MSHGVSSEPGFARAVQLSAYGSTGPRYADSHSLPELPGLPTGESSSVSSITRPINSSSEDLQIRLLAELESFVDRYRRGGVSKTETISSILRVLGENIDVSLTEQQKEATFDTYLTEILSIQSFINNSTEPRGPVQLQPTQLDLRGEGPDKRAARRSCTLHSPWLSGRTPVGLCQSGGHPPDSGHLYWTPLDVRWLSGDCPVIVRWSNLEAEKWPD